MEATVSLTEFGSNIPPLLLEVSHCLVEVSYRCSSHCRGSSYTKDMNTNEGGTCRTFSEATYCVVFESLYVGFIDG